MIALVALLLVPSMTAQAGVVRQLTDYRGTRFGAFALDDAGTSVFVSSCTNQLGGNSDHVFQIYRFDTATGVGQQVTSFPKGVSNLPDTLSVSDDGQWLAFVSRSDPVGQNHDARPEVFVMRADGTGLAQRTNDPAVNAGSTTALALSGSANRIVFLSNSNPLGTNPSLRQQLFVVNFDGTGLRQLTSASATTSAIWYGITISDDGERIAFASNADLTGGNMDRSRELFAIQADGSNLRQLTTTTGGASGPIHPAISGNGTMIAFELLNSFNPSLYKINWDGTGLASLSAPSGSYPSITDDGQFVFFSYTTGGNREIWKIRTDGTGLAELTFSSPAKLDQPIVAGGGSRVAYVGHPLGTPLPAEPAELAVMTNSGSSVRQLEVKELSISEEPAITRDGTRIVFASNADFLGTNPDRGYEIYRVEADGSGLAQVTNIPTDDAFMPSIAADRTTIVFSSDADPLGQNPDESYEIFRIQANGTGLQQLTSFNGTNAYQPEISANGAVVTFYTNGGEQIFKVNADGTGLLQLTIGNGNYGQRIDDTGTWIAFLSYGNIDGTNPTGKPQIYRIRSDGTGLQRITPDNTRIATFPDISGSGARIVYFSDADPVGTNPSHFLQEFIYETATGVTWQLTFGSSTSYGPTISGDGNYVYFASAAPFDEADANFNLDVYRVPAAGGPVQRIGALTPGAPRYPHAPRPDMTGARIAFDGPDDATEQNPDASSEIWLINLTKEPQIRPGKSAPTLVSWDHEAGPLRYDVIRGDVANLGPGPLSTANLGPVACLENDSPDADTRGFEDAVQPAVGHAFFFIYRGSSGLNYGPGSWGQDSAGRQRVPASGACAP